MVHIAALRSGLTTFMPAVRAINLVVRGHGAAPPREGHPWASAVESEGSALDV